MNPDEEDAATFNTPDTKLLNLIFVQIPSNGVQEDWNSKVFGPSGPSNDKFHRFMEFD